MLKPAVQDVRSRVTTGWISLGDQTAADGLPSAMDARSPCRNRILSLVMHLGVLAIAIYFESHQGSWIM